MGKSAARGIQVSHLPSFPSCLTAMRPRQKTVVPVNPRGGRGVGIDDQLNGFCDSVFAVVGGEVEKKMVVPEERQNR